MHASVIKLSFGLFLKSEQIAQNWQNDNLIVPVCVFVLVQLATNGMLGVA